MQTNTNDDFEKDDVSLIEYFRIIYNYKWIVISIFLVIVLFTVIYTLVRPKIYEAKSIVLLDDRSHVQDLLMFANRGLSRTSINNTVEILFSRPVLNLALEFVKREENYQNLPIFNVDADKQTDPILTIRRNMHTVTSREKDTIEIVYRSTDPQEAMLIANAVVEAIILQNTQFARLEYTTAREFLESQLEGVIQRLQISEENLRDYKVDTGVFHLSTETDHLIERSAIANANLLSAQAEYNIAKQNLDFLQTELAIQDSLLLNVALSISTPFIEQLKSEVVRIMTRITTLMNNNDYSNEHPEIIRLQRALDNATNTLDEEIQKTLVIRAGSVDVFGFRNDLIQNISAAQVNENLSFARVNSYQNIVNSFDNRLSLLPDTEMELARLQRNYRIDEHIFSILAENLEDARVAEQARIGNLRVLDRAMVPIHPIKPNKKINLMVGVTLAFIISISVAVLIQTYDTRIRTLDDVDRFVKFQILGTIPLMNLDLKKNKNNLNNDNKKLWLPNHEPKSAVAEAYRTLRTNIIARNPNKNAAIAITSSGPSEGKSTTIANLAITLAQMNSKVIIIDLDLRRPTLHNFFNLERNNGVSDFLNDESMALEDIIKYSDLKNLDIITSGMIPPNPSELIASERTDSLIESLKQKYDYILFDMPPVIAVTDALIMAKKIDMLIMVIMVNLTDRNIIHRTKNMLGNININVTGVVVNGIINEKYYRNYKYYYDYYRY